MRTSEGRFQDLDTRYSQGFFSNNSEDFGHADLVNKDIETWDRLPILQKPYLIFETYHLGTKGVKTLEKVGLLLKVFLPGPVPLWLSQNELNLENPHREGCAWITKH